MTMRMYEAIGMLVDRMLRGQPLLPLEGASQDLAMLAYAIDRQGASIVRVRALATQLQAVGPDRQVRAAHIADEILGALDGAP
jgi:hypothetical protein